MYTCPVHSRSGPQQDGKISRFSSLHRDWRFFECKLITNQNEAKLKEWIECYLDHSLSFESANHPIARLDHIAQEFLALAPDSSSLPGRAPSAEPIKTHKSEEPPPPPAAVKCDCQCPKKSTPLLELHKTPLSSNPRLPRTPLSVLTSQHTEHETRISPLVPRFSYADAAKSASTAPSICARISASEDSITTSGMATREESPSRDNLAQNLAQALRQSQVTPHTLATRESPLLLIRQRPFHLTKSSGGEGQLYSSDCSDSSCGESAYDEDQFDVLGAQLSAAARPSLSDNNLGDTKMLYAAVSHPDDKTLGEDVWSDTLCMQLQANLLRCDLHKPCEATESPLDSFYRRLFARPTALDTNCLGQVSFMDLFAEMFESGSTLIHLGPKELHKRLLALETLPSSPLAKDMNLPSFAPLWIFFATVPFEATCVSLQHQVKLFQTRTKYARKFLFHSEPSFGVKGLNSSPCVIYMFPFHEFVAKQVLQFSPIFLKQKLGS
ncbi:hypothetical protein Ciccas_006651 [Cichlidogyrus casuarinus]|uniref:EF-hand domain-containing protein n=1 Tax=Cichlidogyrus casuarinus TaxID=1844966 RepID=A0ABD2Q564_9PLAT